ncbi:hypothetical protein B4124_0509 [Bacillus licheniformis]|nr:hypothetical protein B4124_0509 [Bacillus licheniformis]TWK35381.1 hypothetical protein CHCC20369_4569 [Bacillus licheniformis]TWK63674.1 hypothetical protein CHCC20344_1621 [Bacillus licheniformis]TWK68354.1 hypothetical protein CHCC20342_2898 [Bacillus licheniformis]TWM03399.1 hypothetical protein CHCC15139_1228 [Bacillus licheniformis]
MRRNAEIFAIIIHRGPMISPYKEEKVQTFHSRSKFSRVSEFQFA